MHVNARRLGSVFILAAALIGCEGFEFQNSQSPDDTRTAEAPTGGTEASEPTPDSEPPGSLASGKWVDSNGDELSLTQDGATVKMAAHSGDLVDWAPTGDGTIAGNQIQLVMKQPNGSTRDSLTGTLSDDGKQIQWRNGGVWKATHLATLTIRCMETSERGDDELYLQVALDGKTRRIPGGDRYQSINKGGEWQVVLGRFVNAGSVRVMELDDTSGDDVIGSVSIPATFVTTNSRLTGDGSRYEVKLEVN